MGLSEVGLGWVGSPYSMKAARGTCLCHSSSGTSISSSSSQLPPSLSLSPAFSLLVSSAIKVVVTIQIISKKKGSKNWGLAG